MGVGVLSPIACMHQQPGCVRVSACSQQQQQARQDRTMCVVWSTLLLLLLRNVCAAWLTCCMMVSATGTHPYEPYGVQPSCCTSSTDVLGCRCCCGWPQSELGLIQRVFTDELMHTILSHLGPYSLGRIACVCQQWRQFAEVGFDCGGRASSCCWCPNPCCRPRHGLLAPAQRPDCAICCMPRVASNPNMRAPPRTHCAAGTPALAGSQPGGVWAVPQGRALLLRARAAAVQVRPPPQAATGMLDNSGDSSGRLTGALA